MANTYTLISSNVLTGSAASVTFSAIPSTFTDLVLKWSGRSDRVGNTDAPYVRVNGLSGTEYSRTLIYGAGSAGTGSGANSNVAQIFVNTVPAANYTSNTFSNCELYLPNYAGSANKPMSVFTATETNATAVDDGILGIAGLVRTTSAITSLTITTYYSQFVSGSSFYLYGIKNS